MPLPADLLPYSSFDHARVGDGGLDRKEVRSFLLSPRRLRLTSADSQKEVEADATRRRTASCSCACTCTGARAMSQEMCGLTAIGNFALAIHVVLILLFFRFCLNVNHLVSC